MVSIGKIIYDLQRHPLMTGILKSDVVRHVTTVINRIGAPSLYEDAITNLTITNFRAQLPPEFVSRTSVRRILDDGDEDSQIVKVVLTHNTDDAATTYGDLNDEGKANVDMIFTHKIVGEYIYVDFETGTVELIYKGYKLDGAGFPYLEGGSKIADTALQSAIEWYIKQQHYEGLWAVGKLPDKVYNHAMQQYHWYIGQATNAVLMPDPIEAEAIGNAIVRLIPNSDSLETSFKYGSQKEVRKW